jgi:hypothetical protein
LNLLISRTARFGQLQQLLLMASLVALPAAAAEHEGWRDWRVDGARVNRHLTELSRFGRNPQGGVSVEGQELAERLRRGPIPLDAALEIAKQIDVTLAFTADARHGVSATSLRPSPWVAV